MLLAGLNTEVTSSGFFFLLFLLLLPPMKMLNCIFSCVFILLIVLPPVLSCSSIKLKLEIKFKKYAFLVKKHLEKYYTSDTNLVAVKAKFHATVSLLRKSAVYMYVYMYMV